MQFLTRWLRPIAAGLLLLVLVLGGLWLRSCQLDRQRAAQSKVDRGQAEAFGNSAADAVGTIGNVAAGERASEDLTRSNREEIENAKGADAAVDPGVAAAGLRALCRRAAYRDRPECRVQPARP